MRSQPEAWQITIGILQSQVDVEAKLFAATTLRGKVDAPETSLSATRS
jgi:hypothetical protein